MTIERDLFRKFMNESEPKNEVKVFRNSIDFQNIGCGFDVEIGSTKEGKVSISLDGFSNNTSTNAEYVSKELTAAYKLGPEEGKAMNDKVVAVKEEIFQELVAVANELDLKVDQIFKKHNFSRSTNESIEDDEETAICAWCKEEFPIYDMKKEVNLGYLCDSCQRAIESRGEELTFEGAKSENRIEKILKSLEEASEDESKSVTLNSNDAYALCAYIETLKDAIEVLKEDSYEEY